MTTIFEMSSKAQDVHGRLLEFARKECLPAEAVFYEQLSKAADRWQPVPVMEDLKRKAKAAGLWNLFLPESKNGAGLTVCTVRVLKEIGHVGAPVIC